MQMLGKSDAVLIGFDVPDAADPADLARHSIDFWLTTEDLPLPDNRVTLGAGRRASSLRYTPTNLEAHQRLREKFKSLLDTMQLPRRGLREPLSTSAAGSASAASPTRTARSGSAPTRRRPRSTSTASCTISTTSTSPTPASSSPAPR